MQFFTHCDQLVIALIIISVTILLNQAIIISSNSMSGMSSVSSVSSDSSDSSAGLQQWSQTHSTPLYNTVVSNAVLRSSHLYLESHSESQYQSEVLPQLSGRVWTPYEQTYDWDDSVKSTFKILEKYNTSAVLYLIELTHNFSSDNYAKCSRTSLLKLNYRVNINVSYHLFKPQTLTAVKTANLLTNLFTRHEHEPQPLSANQSLPLKKDFFKSLLGSNIQSDESIYASGISFAGTDNNHFAPFVYQNLTNGAINILYQDLADSLYATNATPIHSLNSKRDNYSLSGDWYWRLATANYTTLLSKWQHKSEYALVDDSDGVWTQPYLDCGLTNTWLQTYLVPFFGSTIARFQAIQFKGVVFISVNLRQIDINQCAQHEHESLFAGTHKCPLESQCLPIKGKGFRRGAYKCQCNEGFYIPNKNKTNTSDKLFNELNTNYFSGAMIEESFIVSLTENNTELVYNPKNFVCIPCQSGCKLCNDGSPCFVQYNIFLRACALGLQSFCATITFIIAVSVCKLRRSKTVAQSRWIMLEMILIGAFILYITVIIRYFESTTLSCFLEPWFREIGFAFCYGAIVIKLYRIFAEFQTRKAHRVCVRDKDLLKYLAGIILVVLGYMAAWTALVLDGFDDLSTINWFDNSVSVNSTSRTILEEKVTQDGLRFIVCKQLSWDYVTEIGELIFLLTGVYITYCIRNAKKEIYREKWTLACSVYLETIISFVTYAVKHGFWSHPDIHPDYLFLLYMTRCQLTVSIMLIILFFPKLWYHHRPQRSEHHRSRHLSSVEVPDSIPEAMKLHAAILSNGELDIGDINLADMDPEDIRSELRRVYTQLQVLRNKTMRKDNPHISKRRGGRKTHRRFSLQPFHHKHKHEQEVTEISRTPEESTASGDGMSAPDGPSTARIDSDAGISAKTAYVNKSH